MSRVTRNEFKSCFKNVSSKSVIIKKGTKVARYSPANRVPPKLAPKLSDPHLGLSSQQTEKDSQPELSVKATRCPDGGTAQ